MLHHTAVCHRNTSPQSSLWIWVLFCWRRDRLPTPVFWPGEFHGLYSPWGRKESDTTEQLSLLLLSDSGSLHFHTHWLLCSTWNSTSVPWPGLHRQECKASHFQMMQLFPQVTQHQRIVTWSQIIQWINLFCSCFQFPSQAPIFSHPTPVPTNIWKMCVCTWSLQLCPTLCELMDCSPPRSSVWGILQVRILEWVAMSSSRGSSWPREWTSNSCVFCIAGEFFTAELLGKPNLDNKRREKNFLSFHSHRPYVINQNLITAITIFSHVWSSLCYTAR